ncbi:integral membrane protein MviN [Planctopirus limnophila DSM 3776]|uniref:Integral membrane protein MviN n=1 Tax=Planctopirus limnophila (strain ATCC 43296 / DSM 3776 / IFAM 1008 / Mu 290) TaxID=521674 RepID=D5SNC0_PLAL2|nr:murein biosynthesis integral membrane protein MurJ [Planctopirus limnophila]ADG66047.1 integral membrane protein MviN [Planctopirus limnophila DSM 3776]
MSASSSGSASESSSARNTPQTPSASNVRVNELAAETNLDTQTISAHRVQGAQESMGSWRLVSLCTLLSRIFGLIRDAAMAALFGSGPLLDAFTIAFRLPNLARVLLGEGVLATAFLPQLLEVEREEGQRSAFRLATALCILLFGGLSLAVLFTQLILLLGVLPWLSNPDNQLLCWLTIYLLPYVVFVCAAAQLSTILHAFHRFMAAALIPVVLNLGWLLALALVAWLIESPQIQIQILALLIVVLGFIQCLALVPSLWQVGFRYQSDWWQARSKILATISRMGPILGALLVLQFSAVWESAISWLLSADGTSSGQGVAWLGGIEAPLPSGAATFLYLGQRLYQFPLGIFGVALGTVLYPLLSRHAQAHDWQAFRSSISLAARLVLAIGVPASVGLFSLALPVTDLLFGRGAFNWPAIEQTARVIQTYSLGIWAMCGLVIAQRAFYALDDRWTPLNIAFIGTATGMLTGLCSLWWLGTSGLAWGTTVSAIMQVLWNYRRLYQKIPVINSPTDGNPGSSLAVLFMKIAFCNGAMALVCQSLLWVASQYFVLHGSTFDRLMLVMIPMTGSILAFALTSRLVRYKDPWIVLQRRVSIEP